MPQTPVNGLSLPLSHMRDLLAATSAFQDWTGDTSLLADPGEWHTKFIMPNNDVHFYAQQDSTGPIEFEYETIQGVENLKNVYYKFPESSFCSRIVTNF